MKKYMKKYLYGFIVSVAAFCACDTYDDAPLRNDIKLLEERVSSIEKWCETAKTDLSSLQTLVLAMDGRDYIQSVELILVDGYEKGYTITFASGKVIKVWNGEKGDSGDTPLIGISQDSSDPDDANYYWTVKLGSDDPEFMRDNGGNKIPVGHTPIISVGEFEGNLYWKIDGEWLLDSNGNKVVAKGSDGVSFFSAVDCTSDPDNVKFTLADGSSFTVRRSASESQKIVFAGQETGLNNGFYSLSKDCDSLEITLNVKYEDYSALCIKVYSCDDDNISVVTKGTASEWPFAVEHKPFADGSSDARALVRFSSLDSHEYGDLAIVEVTLILVSGETFTSSKIVEYFDSEVVLDGLFTVNNDGKQARFSRGNLTGSEGNYSFTAGQQELGGLFLQSGISSALSIAGTTWNLLSADEWEYLFYTHNYKVVTVDGVLGYVVMPDKTKIPEESDFNSLVSLGAVFFPAAGSSEGSGSRASAGTLGNYLSSTSGKALSFNATSYNASASVSSTAKVSARPVIFIEETE